MILWASSEVFQPASESSEVVRHALEPYLNRAFGRSVLSTFDVKLRYIPVIMPAGMRERHPERSLR